MRPGLPGPGAVYRSGPSARRSRSLCDAVPATGHGQGRRVRALLVTGSAGADQSDDRPVYLPLRSRATVSDRLRLVVAGAGQFGSEHMRILSMRDDVTLVGVADIVEAAAENARERFGALESSTD